MTAVVVMLPDGQAIGFETPEALQAALTRGAQIIGMPAATPSTASAEQVAEKLLDAEQLAAALSLPLNWVEEAARGGRIPFLRAGRYVRFRRSDVEKALKKGLPATSRKGPKV